MVQRLGAGHVHPSGPLFVNKDAGVWTEELLDCAKREFREETGFDPGAGPFIPLGSVKQKGGKTVHAFAAEGDCDPAVLASNTFKLEWPPKSGKRVTVPEVDRAAWFTLDVAVGKINPAQVKLLNQLGAIG